MSKKTMKQRIALVAVTALTAGVLSVATSPLANAAIGDISVGTGTGQGIGTCSVLNTATGTYSVLNAGSLNHSSTLAAPLSVTIPVGGTVDFNPEGTAAGGGFVTYTAGLATDDTTAEVLHSSYGVYAVNMSGDSDTLTLTATAVGTISVKAYVSAPFASVNVPNTILATPNGALSITVVASCSGNGYSATYSAFQVDAAVDSTPSLTYGDTLTFSAGSDGYISVVGKNSYDAALPASTTWVASATNNAKVLLGTTSAIEATTTARGTLSVVSTTAAGTNVYVRVNPADRAAGGTTTVTLTADGVSVLSKTLTFLPEASKLVVVKNMIGSISAAGGGFSFQLQTASGTVVPGSISVRPLTLDSRVTSVTEVKAATIAPVAPTGNIGGVAATTNFSSTTANGVMSFACNTATTSGTTTVTMRHTTAVNETIIDTPVTLTCAGSLATYTLSTDKATYRIGEIATVTFTGKDSAGNAVNDFAAFSTDALAVGGGSMVKNTATSDYFSGGVKTFQAQMTTAGTFNIVSTLSGSTTKTATAGYTVTEGTATVSNAQVLQSIVALIASINKQIQALQKLILARR